MRLIIRQKAELSRRLFQFLASVLDGRPRADGPLLVERRVLRDFYQQPDLQVVELLRHCRHDLSVEVRRNASVERNISASRHVLGLTIAAHNCLPGATLFVSGQLRGADVVGEFTSDLIRRIPVAKTLPDMMMYHCVLRSVVPQPDASPSSVPQSLLDLIGKSPLTTLTALDAYSNPELEPLASELLKPGSGKTVNAAKRRRRSAWEQSVDLILSDGQLAGWLRRQWLDLPETRRVCRDQGLILEFLRRGNVAGHRDVVLEFYEAYERLRFKDPAYQSLFDVIEEHLRAQGHGDAVLRLNRWGNEYLLKFLPLIEIIIEESRLPEKYRHLTTDLALAIKRLLPYAVWNIRRRIVFTPVTIGSEAEA